MKHNLEANKQNAIAFYRMAYLGEPAEAVKQYVGAVYIQHNPLVPDGKEGFIAYFRCRVKRKAAILCIEPNLEW
ncbi:MAG: hypothetical protein KDJ65_37185 [Anaerolineae bacterium]|nr:hypothetical protein [Anaerolineae bacterium]